MTNTTSCSGPAIAAETRGCLFALLGRAFGRPDGALSGMLPAAEALLRGQGLSVDDNAAVTEALTRLLTWPPMRTADHPSARAKVVDELCEDYDRFFGHAVRGLCPPYELEYGRGDIVQQAPLLADLVGFYSAFGLALREEIHERPDHVSVQCEFFAILKTKEAYAISFGDRTMHEAVEAAERAFLENHLGRWLPALAARIEEADADGFFGRAARLASVLITAECQRLGVEPGPRLMELAPADPVRDTSIDCAADVTALSGTSEDLVQIGFEGGPQHGP